MSKLRALAVTSVSLVAIVLGCHIQSAAAASPEMIARERAGCMQMGFNPGEVGFDNCMISLNRSAAAIERTNIIDSYRETCARQGLEIGTTPFDVCVVKMRNAALGSRGLF